MSKITTPQIVGISSTVISLGTIFATVAAIGIPIGVQRFLGKSFSEQKLDDARLVVKISLLLTFIGVASCITLLLMGYNWFYAIFKLDFSLIIVTISLVASSAVMALLRSIVIASLNTKMLPVIMILSTIAKIALAVILVVTGAGALGVTIGFTFFPVIGSILLAGTIIMIFKHLPRGSPDLRNRSLKNEFKILLIAGGASWLPYVIHTTASYLGPLLVFSSNGASQAGVYFIAYSLFIALSAIMSVLFTIAYPALSAMRDGRKRLAWRITKLSILISLPLSSSLIFYSQQIMQLFGREYVVGSPSLEILLLSTLPILVMTGINTLVNSYGNYRHVLTIGFATNIPSAISYFIFVPIFDNGIGAAMSYTLGSIIGLIVSVFISKKIEMQIFWREIAFILTLPLGFAFLLSYFQVNYVIGIPLTLALSYSVLLRLRVITRIDIQDSVAIIPTNITYPVLNMFNIIRKKLNGIK